MQSPSRDARIWMLVCAGSLIAGPGCLFDPGIGDSEPGTSGAGASGSGAGASTATSTTSGVGASTSTSTSTSSTGTPPECFTNEDCAFLDNDDDVCTIAVCNYDHCEPEIVTGTTECQCQADADCDYYVKPCNVVTCAAHQCTETIVPAGAAAEQYAGDCSTVMCDGVSADATTQFDGADVPNDGNECTTDSCVSPTGPTFTAIADGTACDAGIGICFTGDCLPCAPQNPQSCGGEGPDEPQNDSGGTPTSYARYSDVCGFSNGADADWYTFYANDADFVTDIMNFDFWSTAPLLEVCAYVKCWNGGSPGGGCAAKLPGPDGSQGCCWTGAPNTLVPSWDLDCDGTSEDSGTVYFSIKTPGGGACERYAMTANY